MKYFYLVVMTNVIGFSIEAAPPFDNIKDLSEPFHAEYSHLSPVIGADDTGLRNFRLQGGHYGSQPQEQFPRYEKHQAIVLDDKAYPQDAIAAVLQRLFPSPDGHTFVANTVQDEKKELHLWLKPENIAALLNVIKDPEDFIGKEDKEKEVLKGIVRSLQPEIFKQEKIIKKLETAKKINTELNFYQKFSSFKFAELLLKAVKESYRPSDFTHGYPPHILEESLLSYMWQKIETKEELKPFYEGLSPDIINHEKVNLIEFEHDRSSYTKNDYLALKEKVLEDPNFISKIAYDPEKLTLLGLGYTYYEDSLPPIVNYKTTIFKESDAHKEQSFADCVETTLRNFWYALLYNRDNNSFRTDIFKKLEDQYGLKPRKSFLHYFEEITPNTSNITTSQAHDGWTRVVSNLNDENTIDPISYKHYNYEITSGLTNTLKVIGKLLNDPQWMPMNKQGADLEKAIKFNLDRLCTFFSQDGFKLSWQGKNVFEKSENICDSETITFLTNDIPQFELIIQTGHTYFQKTKEQTDLDWRRKVGELLVKENLIKDWISPYHFFSPYTLDNIQDIPQEKSDSIFAGVLHGGDFDSIFGKIETICKIMTFKNIFQKNTFEEIVRRWVSPTGEFFDNWRDTHTTWSVLNALAVGKNVEEIESLGITAFNNILKNVNKPKFWKDGTGSLHHAAFQGHEGIIRLLIEKGANLDIQDRNYGYTALSIAAQEGNESIVCLLIKNKADIEIGDTRGYGLTPLHQAILLHNPKMVSLLLESGADVNKMFPEKMPVFFAVTPLHHVINSCRKNIKEEFENDLEIISILLKRDNIDLHKGNKFGNTPLHDAAQRDLKEIMCLLFENNADANIKNNLGYTPLHFAVRQGKKDNAALLLNHGANINEQRQSGDTPLHDAVDKGYKDIVHLLLEKGANRELMNNKGETPFTMAQNKGNKEIILLFSETKA